jgi:beta-lactamase superfamily II metal-dependent hydrolase
MSEPIEVHVFGAKKGESIVLKLPGNFWGVVDNYTPVYADPRSNPTLRFLESRNVSHLGFLCLTHPHHDHYRGMGHLLDRFDPDRVWLFGATTHRDLHARVAEVLRLKADTSNFAQEDAENADELVGIFDKIRQKSEDNTRTPKFEVGLLQLDQRLLRLDSDPPLTITAIAPPGTLSVLYAGSLASCFDAGSQFLAQKLPSVNHNLISGGLLIEYGRVRIALGGDMEADSWQEAMKRFDPEGRLGSALVKVSHHGSANGYCPGLWAKLSPGNSAIAVITPYTSQGLPSPDGLQHIKAHARSTLTPSLSAIALANNWGTQETAFDGLSLEALVALRSLFPKARKSSERLEGRCSFTLAEDGSVAHMEAGEAGEVR